MNKPKVGDVVQSVDIEPGPDAPIKWSSFGSMKPGPGVVPLPNGPIQFYEAPWPPKPSPEELKDTVWRIE